MTTEIQARGRALQQRFRSAGIPQYTRWFRELRPQMAKDDEMSNRIRKVFNGEGSVRDTALVILCEELTDLHLPKKAA